MRNRQCGIAIALALAFIVCACGASQRHKTVMATYEATNLASEQLVYFAHEHETIVVDTSHTAEEAKAQLEAFRKKIDHAEHSLDAVYRAIASAALLDDDKSLATLVQVAAILMTELKELGIKLP